MSKYRLRTQNPHVVTAKSTVNPPGALLRLHFVYRYCPIPVRACPNYFIILKSIV